MNSRRTFIVRAIASAAAALGLPRLLKAQPCYPEGDFRFDFKFASPGPAVNKNGDLFPADSFQMKTMELQGPIGHTGPLGLSGEPGQSFDELGIDWRKEQRLMAEERRFQVEQQAMIEHQLAQMRIYRVGPRRGGRLCDVGSATVR